MLVSVTVPLVKLGKDDSVPNVTPVSLLGNLCKLFEKVLSVRRLPRDDLLLRPIFNLDYFGHN